MAVFPQENRDYVLIASAPMTDFHHWSDFQDRHAMKGLFSRRLPKLWHLLFEMPGKAGSRLAGMTTSQLMEASEFAFKDRYVLEEMGIDLRNIEVLGALVCESQRAKGFRLLLFVDEETFSLWGRDFSIGIVEIPLQTGWHDRDQFFLSNKDKDIAAQIVDYSFGKASHGDRLEQLTDLARLYDLRVISDVGGLDALGCDEMGFRHIQIGVGRMPKAETTAESPARGTTGADTVTVRPSSDGIRNDSHNESVHIASETVNASGATNTLGSVMEPVQSLPRQPDVASSPMAWQDSIPHPAGEDRQDDLAMRPPMDDVEYVPPTGDGPAVTEHDDFTDYEDDFTDYEDDFTDDLGKPGEIPPSSGWSDTESSGRSGTEASPGYDQDSASATSDISWQDSPAPSDIAWDNPAGHDVPTATSQDGEDRGDSDIVTIIDIDPDDSPDAPRDYLPTDGRTEEVIRIANEMSSWGTSDLLGSASRIADDARRNGRGDDLVPMAFAILCQQMLRADGTFPSAMQIDMAFRMHDGISVSIDHAKRESAILLVAFCEALLGNQVHVISEDMTFLEKASRHASSLLPTFNLSVAQEIRAQNDGEDRRAYGSDVIYGTPLEFGCDYLRNSISGDYSDGTWMRLDVAIVDDAQLLLSKGDSILLSIKGASSEGGNDGYHSIAEIVRNLITSDDPDDESCDIVVDMSRRKVLIRAAGAERIKERVATVGLNRSYDTTDLTRRIQCALQAEYLLARGRDYVVEDGHVILLDPRTGTTMRDRRWSNGLHEAVEAKEGLVVREPGQQLATMTVNEFISLYGKAVAVN